MAEDRFCPASPLLGRAQKIQYAFQLFFLERGKSLSAAARKSAGREFEIHIGRTCPIRSPLGCSKKDGA
jgi:hypothetical protein